MVFENVHFLKNSNIICTISYIRQVPIKFCAFIHHKNNNTMICTNYYLKIYKTN